LGIIAGHTKLLEHMSGKIASPVAFDTGGYTGAWGAEGRLGILHEKELVLNASDTSNLLASLDIASNILTQISNPMEMFKNIADMTNALNL
jgi:hypothetical protein